MQEFMNKIVITGATSMVGLNFIQYLLNKEVEIVAIIRKNSSRKNLIPKSKKIKVVESNLDELKDLNIEEKCDVFVHLAWQSAPETSVDSVYVQNMNVKCTLDAVHLAKRIGCKRFIGAGSQAEYGRVEGKLLPTTRY